MSFRQAFTSALHLFILLAFFVAGVFLVSLAYLPELKKTILETDLTEAGLAVFGASFFLFVCFFALNRGKYLRIRMGGGNIADVDMKVIHQTIEEIFQTHQIPLHEVGVHFETLEISISLKKEDEEQLSKLEKELTVLLRNRFGYSKPFYLVAKT